MNQETRESQLTGIYAGVRATDMQSVHWHALAENIKDLSKLTDRLIGVQQGADALISHVQEVSESTADIFNAAAQDFSSSAVKQKQDVIGAVDRKIGELNVAIRESVASMRDAGIGIIKQSAEGLSTPLEKITNATNELLKASRDAESGRIAANDARIKLIDYKKELDAYETLVLKRCNAAVQSAHAGLSWKSRLMAVFSPPKTNLATPKAPSKPQ